MSSGPTGEVLGPRVVPQSVDRKVLGSGLGFGKSREKVTKDAKG